ncbi:MAG: CHAD domain-containing protein [Gloeobacterales cyanobacterium]
MAKTTTPPRPKKSKLEQAPTPEPALTSASDLGGYAYSVIAQQYQHMVQQEQGVLADQDPEYLHQMRVGARRLSTALEVFGCAVKLPKAARKNRVRTLAKALGKLRDLDVQTHAIRTDYCPRLSISENALLNIALNTLDQQRSQACKEVEKILAQPFYEKLKAAYEDWLKKPKYTSLADLPLLVVLPDLLNPLLSAFMLHPGWQISAEDRPKASSLVLHDLRKLCKAVRYQAEFFTDFYDQAFQNWIDEVKELQDSLGKVQDTHVLRKLLSDELPKKSELPELQKFIQETLDKAMMNWGTLRHQYLDPAFRHRLHQMILEPSTQSLKS